MPTRTGSSSRDRLREGEQPSYKPGGEYQPWDHESGGLRLTSGGDSRDAAFSDNGRDYYGDRLDNSRSSGRELEQPGYSKGGISDSLDSLRQHEDDASRGRERFYTSNGKKAQNDRTKAKSQKRKAAVVGVIAALIVGGGAFLGSSNSLLAPAMEALFTEATDTQYASASMRSTHLMRYYLTETGATSTTWTGAKKYSAMSGAFKSRLAKQGITIEGSGSNKTLVYTKTNADGIEVTQRITASEFSDVYRNDVDFRDSYTTAKRGRVATFFDNIADKIYQKLGLSRNLFSSFRQTGDSEADMASYKDTMSEKFENNKSTAIVDVKQEKEVEVDVVDDDGNITGTTTEIREVQVTDKTDNTMTSSGSTSVDVAETKAGAMIRNVAESVTQAGQWICSALRVGNMISVMVAANEIYQSINYFMGLMENVSKMKAGEGDASALNEVLNFLSTPAYTKTSNLGKLTVSGSGESTVINADEYLEQNGAPLESNGMQKILANAPINTGTSKNYSLERVMNSVSTALTTSVATITACNVADVASSIVSIAVTVSTLGLSTVGQILGKIALGVGTSIVISSLFSFLVPTIAKTLFTNVFDTAIGIPAGELFTKGASAANTRLGRNGSGQSLSSDVAAAEYNRINNTVLALDAEVERKNHSPFDLTNKNTFFGSIAYNLLPTIANNKTLSVSNFLRTTSSSLASIIGRVYADGTGSSYMTTYGECPTLASIGAVGDIYCNPVTTTDTSTLDLSPDDNTYQNVLKNGVNDGPNMNCDSDGNCTIIDKSNLAKYISFCANRDSPFGVADQNILGSLQVGNSFINSIPIIGDLVSIFDAGISEANIPWANGERCGNTESNATFWNAEGKYYQRYVEDTRLLEEMGAFEETNSTNPVTAYIEAYEEAHPLDNSYEGYLARISGLTKDNVETVLAFIEYADFLENYDIESRVAFQKDTILPADSDSLIAVWEQTNDKKLSPETPIDDPIEIKTIARQHVVYFDVRNRSYAV